MAKNYRNKPISLLCIEDKITQNEYDILFEDKTDYNEKQVERFTRALNKVIEKSNGSKILDLSYIHFCGFTFSSFNLKDFKEIVFSNCIFKNYFYADKKNSATLSFKQKMNFKDSVFEISISFRNYTFQEDVTFDRAVFNKSVMFDGTTFKDSTSFRWCEFKDSVSFENVHFCENANFIKSKFCKEAYFSNAIFDNTVLFEHTLFKRGAFFQRVESNKYISFAHMQLWTNSVFYLNNSRFSDASFLNLLEANGSFVTAKHFINKETARLIKSQFEKQNNITEANKYFEIEQKLFLDELKKDGFWKNKENIVAVKLHQLVSKSGTSWIRVLLWIIVFSFAVLLWHDYPENISNLFSIDGFIQALNRMSELINPVNIFRNSTELYKGYEFVGILIRVITLYLFWQFAVAFRQNTRRK